MSETPLVTPTPPAPAPVAPIAPVAPPPAPLVAGHARRLGGWILVVLGALLLADSLLPAIDPWITPVVFAGAGAGCLALYAARPARHWLILGGGFLVSLGAVVAWTQLTGDGGGSVLFAGAAATFLGYAAAPPAPNSRRWGYWAAVASLAVAVLATGISWAWPLALIVAGAWLLLSRAAGSHA